MKKNILAVVLFGSLFSYGAQAEYLGINDLAMKSENTPLAFMNAVKETNYDLVKQWLDQGYSLSYKNSDKEWCSVSLDGTTKINTAPKNTEQYIGNLRIAASGGSSLLILPSDCDGLPLVRVAGAFRSMYSVDVAKYNESIKNNSDYKYQEKVYNLYQLLSSKLPESQYEQYYIVALNPDTPASIRVEALEKFIDGYKKKDKILDPVEKPYHDAVIEASKSPTDSGYDTMVMGITNPGYVIMNQLFGNYVKYLKDYVDVYKKHPDGPKPNMEMIKNGGVDLSKYNLSDYNEMDLDTLIQLNGTMKMIKILMDSGIYDINSQNSDGNTVFHNLFDKSLTFGRLKYSEFSGSFVRYLLENGANPLLENKEGKTAYLIFEQNKDNDSSEYYKGLPKVSDAFVQKEYKD